MKEVDDLHKSPPLGVSCACALTCPFRITTIKHILPQKRPEDEGAGKGFVFRPVTGIFIHQSNDVWTLEFDSGDTLGVTSNHLIYSTTAQDWRLAGELVIGEQVLVHAGSATLTGKRPAPAQRVYNLEVQAVHNFLVSGVGVVVHNTGLCNWLKSFFDDFSTWRKAEPDWGLDESKVSNLMDALAGNDPLVYSQPILTTTYNGQSYLINGHHRLKTAKRLKLEQGIDVELQHANIAPDKIHEVEGGRFENIQDLINQSFAPNE